MVNTSVKLIASVLCCAMLATSCSELPSSGPTQAEFLNSAAKDNPLGFKIVDITPGVIKILSDAPAPDVALKQDTARAEDVDRIGIGDELSVYIFEIGSGIFSGRLGSGGNSFSPPSGAMDQALPKFLVDTDGYITVPYSGRVRAAGLTPYQLEREIESRLKKTSQHAQVVVEIANNVANTVVVSGDVKNPGRHSLTLAHETLLDMIALSGGPSKGAVDTVVTVTGRSHSLVVPLTRIATSGPENFDLDPGDRIQLTFRPRTFTVFGASGRVSELSFDSPRLSLAEAIARSGGPNDSLADPTAIYLFRYETPQISAQLGVKGPDGSAPVVYHLDLLDTTSYFEMGRFQLRDKDLIVVANSRLNKLQKLMEILSGLFTPVLVGQTLSTQ